MLAQGVLRACSGSAQACSPSAQAKAATGQVGGRNWNWGKKILCPTIGVLDKDYDLLTDYTLADRLHDSDNDPTSYSETSKKAHSLR